ncbi:MAG TPA: hypothetical protein VGM39_09750 [Kofleriaceae bacterium]
MRDATAAVRDRAADGVDDGAATRLRIRESMTRPAPRRRFTLVAAVIATMFGGTAFAYVAAVKAGWVESPFHHDAPAPVVAPALPPEKIAAPTHRGSGEVPSGDVIGSMTMEAPNAAPVDANLGMAATDQSAPIEVPAAPTQPVAPVVVAQAPVVPKAPLEKAPRVEQSARPDLIKAPRQPITHDAPNLPTRPAVTAEIPNPPVDTAPAPVEQTPAPQQVTQPATPVEVAPSAELAAYRHAHELHFRGGDPKAALTAWDDYLKSYPNGSLAPDARYDRAILLVKLGRYADARAALLPFASAAVGAYKQKEATEILAAIKDR